MMKITLDIKTIQYMNLFERTTGIKAKDCFTYNNMIIFSVPRQLMGRALGRQGSNVERMEHRINRKVRVVANPIGLEDLDRFTRAVMFPYKFKRIALENEDLVIYSMPRTKSVLIGRDKTRLKEISDIERRFFGIKRVLIK